MDGIDKSLGPKINSVFIKVSDEAAFDIAGIVSIDILERETEYTSWLADLPDNVEAE